MAAPTSLRDTRVVRFSPTGLSDSLDETDEFPGACSVLKDLIPDPSTKNIWTCRPAAFTLFTLNGQTPGVVTAITALKVIGSYIAGWMSITTGPYSGKDFPFMYYKGTSFVQNMWNAKAANIPTTISTSNPNWFPPTIDQVGNLLYFTHPGYTAAIGWLDLTYATQGNFFWNAGNLPTAGHPKVLTSLVGGTGYPYAGPNNPFSIQNTTGGTGSGATIAIVTNPSGTIIAAWPMDTGTGYTAGDVLTISGGTGGTVTAASLTSGKIQFAAGSQILWVKQFYQRAWFGVFANDGVTPSSTPFTDILSRDTSNANQVLTYGDPEPLVASAGLGLNNQLGGIVQSLMIFKDDSNIIQITGDYALNTLSSNTLNVAIGTIAPRTVVNTPNGVMFLAPDGFRLIDFDAHVSDPIGNNGSGVVVPFINNGASSILINAACNGQVLRVSVLNVPAGNVWQEYWYDLVRKVWSGPHSFPSTCIEPNTNTFLMAPQADPANIWQSDIVQSSTSSFVENGQEMSWVMNSAVLSDNGQMAMSELTEMQVKTTSSSSVNNITVQMLDQDGNPIGTFIYNYSLSQLAFVGLYPRRIDFSAPVVYARAEINVSGASGPGLKIGDTFIRQRILGYLQAIP